MLSFLAIAVLLVIGAIAVVAIPLLRGNGDDAAPVAGTLSAILIPASVLLLYAGISSYPWQSGIPVADTASQPTAEEAQSMAAAIRGLEQRLSMTPDDVEGWLLLGRSYVTEQRFTDASNAYRKVLELTDGTHTDAKIGLAETLILSDRELYGAEAGRLIDQVLAVEPDNRKALWYGGQIALGQDNVEAARQRWSRLLTLSPPENLRKILQLQLDALDGPVTPPEPATPSAAMPGITVNVDIDESLRAQVKDGARLFIVARDADRPGPPLAAVPRLARDLPLTVRITDADRMIPDRSLADVARVKVIARVANGGDALPAPGDIFGEALVQGVDQLGEPVAIILDQVVPQ